jgi:hypothetical protein
VADPKTFVGTPSLSGVKPAEVILTVCSAWALAVSSSSRAVALRARAVAIRRGFGIGSIFALFPSLVFAGTPTGPLYEP